MQIEFYSLNGVSLKPVIARTLPDGRIEIEDTETSGKLFARYIGQEFVNPWGVLIEIHAIFSRAQRWNRETAPARGGKFEHAGWYDGD